MKFKDLFVGQVLDSKSYGSFTIIEIVDSKNITVQFIETGYVKCAQASAVLAGAIKDLYVPGVYGVGFIGSGAPSQVNGKMVRSYVIWKEMLRRVYCPKSLALFPTYKDCKVCDRWHNYQLFLEDLPNIEGYELWLNSEKRKVQLDKDTKYPGNKIYSLETCRFITDSENSNAANFGRRKNKEV